MNTVTPTGGNTPAPNSAAAPAGSIGQAVSIPGSALQILRAGQNIAGEVVARPDQGQITVKTAQGNVTLATNNPPPKGSAVNLILQSAGPPATVQIQTQPHLQSTQLNLLQQANSLLNKLISAPTSQPAQTVVTNLTQGSNLLATVLSQGAQVTNAQGQVVLSTSGLPPQSGPAPSPQPRGNTPAAAATDAPAKGPSGPLAKIAQAIRSVTGNSQGQAQAQLPGGYSVPMRILNIALPNGGPLPPYPAAAAKSGNMLLTGTVTSSSASQTIVQTPAGTLSLPTSQALPIGTSLQLMITGQPQLSATANQLNAADMGLRWQALQEAMALLQAGNPAAATRLLSIVPQSSPALGTTLMFLFNAMRGGAVDRWLGKDTLKALEAQSKGSAGRLTNTFQAAQGRTTDPAGRDWRVYHMPVLADGNLDDVKLYLRDRPEDEDEETREKRKKEDKRFIVEANFSTLGPMQFDGMSRQKQLDLMIRTQTPLDAELRDGIRALYYETISALGMSGTVGFHVAPQFEVTADELKTAAKGGVTI
ncbi:hypothetical protein [Aestuariispira insulae]|uniref:Uncharacterized protein n=1 Tax=Aestuariispira insulae TaxID=1461337 RepID=A0A3D9HSE9_9PROT|nr:hypothetical protein [Aestuariispira insulae]RED52414.1 hypothetical protein DFP90_102435 [Aestuariispira insulae]